MAIPPASPAGGRGRLGGKPTAALHARYAGLKAQLDARTARVRTVMETDVAAFNKAVPDAGVPAIVVSAPKKWWCT